METTIFQANELDSLSPGTRVWLYIRFSPGDNQTVDSQMMGVRNYCNERGWIIDREFLDEWKSGKTAEDRDGFMLMISQAKLKPKTASAIVMWDTKRFSRNPCDAQFYRAMLRKNGWKLVFVEDKIPDDPILTPLMEVILDIMGQQLLYDIKAGTIRGLKYIAEQGCLPNSQPVIGFVCIEVALGGKKKDGSLRMGRKPEIDPEIARLVINAFELKARGAPIQVIEKETGLYSRNDKQENDDENKGAGTQNCKIRVSGSWNRFFRNRAYIGEFYFHGEIYHNVYPAIMSKELFDAVQLTLPPRILRKRKISDHPRRKHSMYPAANMSFCGYCGGRMEGKSTDGRKKQEEEKNNPMPAFRYYVCSNHNESPQLCPQSSFINAEDIEPQLFEIMTNQVLQKEYLMGLLGWTNQQLNIESEDLLIRVKEMKSRLVNEDHINEKMHRNFLTLDYPTRQGEKQLQEQDVLVEGIRTELKKLEEIYKTSHIETTIKEVEQFACDAQDFLETENIFDIKAIYERLIDHIVMYNDKCIVFLHFPTV